LFSMHRFAVHCEDTGPRLFVQKIGFYTPKGCKKCRRWLASTASVTTGKGRNPYPRTPSECEEFSGLRDPGVAPHSRLSPGYFPCTAPRCTAKTPVPDFLCKTPSRPTAKTEFPLTLI